MKYSFKSIAALAVSAVVGYFVADAFLPSPSRDTPTRAQIEEVVLSNPGGSTLAIIKEGFPTEYDAMMDQLMAIASDRSLSAAEAESRAFALARGASENLRRSNARHIIAAPRENILAIQRLSLELMESVADNKAVCAKLAFGGIPALSREEVKMLNQDTLERSASQTFRAIISGRDTPQQHETASEQDRTAFIEAWRAKRDVPPEAIDAVLRADWKNPLYCDGAISLQKHVIEDASPSGRRILIDVMAAMAST